MPVAAIRPVGPPHRLGVLAHGADVAVGGVVVPQRLGHVSRRAMGFSRRAAAKIASRVSLMSPPAPYIVQVVGQELHRPLGAGAARAPDPAHPGLHEVDRREVASTAPRCGARRPGRRRAAARPARAATIRHRGNRDWGSVMESSWRAARMPARTTGAASPDNRDVAVRSYAGPRWAMSRVASCWNSPALCWSAGDDCSSRRIDSASSSWRGEGGRPVGGWHLPQPGCAGVGGGRRRTGRDGEPARRARRGIGLGPRARGRLARARLRPGRRRRRALRRD